MSCVITTCSGNPESLKKGTEAGRTATEKEPSEKGHGRKGFSDKKRVGKYFKLVYKFAISSVYCMRQATSMKFSATPEPSTINQFQALITIGAKDVHVYSLEMTCPIALGPSLFYLLFVPTVCYFSKAFQAEFVVAEVLPVFVRALRSWWDAARASWRKRDTLSLALSLAAFHTGRSHH